MVVVGISLGLFLMCFPLGAVIITKFLILLWECLSALSVASFAADLLLRDDYEIIDLQEMEVNMENKVEFQGCGVNMG